MQGGEVTALHQESLGGANVQLEGVAGGKRHWLCTQTFLLLGKVLGSRLLSAALFILGPFERKGLFLKKVSPLIIINKLLL